jgi:ABC-type multidrug transport system fused ATPase/permease subunit
MNSKILQTWISLQKQIPKRTQFAIASIIFLISLLEIIGLGAIFPILQILTDPIKLNVYSNSVPLIPAQYFIFSLLFSLIFFYVLKNIFLSYGTYKIFQSVFNLQTYFSNMFFGGLLQSRFDTHRELNANKESSVLVNDIPLVCIEWYLPSIYIISDVSSLLIILLCLVLLNPFLFLAIILVGGILFGSILYFSRRYSYKWGVNRKIYDDIKLDFFNNGLTHIKEIITYNKLSFYITKFSEATSISSRSGMLQSTAQVVPKFFVELVAVTILVSIIFIMIISGESLPSIIPTIGIYTIAAFRFIPLVNRLMQSIQMVQYGADSANSLLLAICERKTNLLLLSSDIYKKDYKKVKFNSLILKELTYSYKKSSRVILNDVSLSIYAGNKIAIVGDSGTGKSTLIDLILGLNEPISGSISFNEHSIYHNLYSWRSQIGYVPQSSHLTSNSLLENITFSTEHRDIDYALLDLVINITEIKNFMAGNYSLPTGHGGVKVSGGQRQRIAIARALYRNPSILIFDEATNALDVESESRILNSIIANFKDITIISITHRIHDNQFYNFIYSLSSGSLIKLNNN